MTGFYVAATVVTLLQFVRLRDKRLVPLMLLFAFAAGSRHFDCWGFWAQLLDLVSGTSALALLFALSPRHTNRSSGPSGA
jgi:hypothetical protein